MLMREPKLNFIDDKDGKPVGINMHIGRRPIAAFGNSDGDFAMLEWVDQRPGRAFRADRPPRRRRRASTPMTATPASADWRAGSTKGRSAAGRWSA